MAGIVDILMYHSISDRGGPTSTPRDVFADQMDALAASGRRVLSIDALAGGWPEDGVVITFDDAFQDFATDAWPILKSHGFPAVVYIPAGHVGGHENWQGALNPPRALMDWDHLRALAEDGVTFGNHSIGHPDLDSLSNEDLYHEIEGARAIIEDRLGFPVRHFAPPYGRASANVRNAIAQSHATSVGTRLGRATSGSDRHDLPRLEMYYFRDPGHWRRHLAGQGAPYLAARKTLRRVRDMISHPSGRA